MDKAETECDMRQIFTILCATLVYFLDLKFNWAGIEKISYMYSRNRSKFHLLTKIVIFNVSSEKNKLELFKPIFIFASWEHFTTQNQ